jgi:hypothetical protein
MTIASAQTNPTITERGTNRMKRASLSHAKPTCRMPVRTVAANMYSRPCSLTSPTITTAMAPVAAEIIPGRPPAKAIVTAMVKDA